LFGGNFFDTPLDNVSLSNGASGVTPYEITEEAYFVPGKIFFCNLVRFLALF